MEIFFYTSINHAIIINCFANNYISQNRLPFWKWSARVHQWQSYTPSSRVAGGMLVSALVSSFSRLVSVVRAVYSAASRSAAGLSRPCVQASHRYQISKIVPFYNTVFYIVFGFFYWCELCSIMWYDRRTSSWRVY